MSDPIYAVLASTTFDFRSNDTLIIDPISEHYKVQRWAAPTWLQMRIQISNVLSNVEVDLSYKYNI